MSAKHLPFARPMCQRPVLIVNSRALDLIYRYGRYVFLGKECSNPLPFRIDSFPDSKKLTRMGYSLAQRCKDSKGYYYKFDYELLSQCYVETDLQFEYLFLVVECRHCPLCIERRRNDYVARCSFESQTSKTPPIMVTLTYKRRYLPHEMHFQHIRLVHPDDEFDKSYYTYETSVFFRDGNIRKYGDGDLNERDVELFLNLLRTKLTRAGRKPVNMRYVVCGEYGKKGRPHYHFLFWNVPFAIRSQFDQELIDQFKSFVLDAWKMCIPNACQCEVARSAARYCTKYMTKLDSHGRKGFFHSSRGKGVDGWKGIGSKFLADNADFFREHPDMNCIPFLDKWSGELQKYTFGKYALDKVFPSGSSYLSKYSFKDDFKQLCRDGAYVRWLFDRLFRVHCYQDLCRELRQFVVDRLHEVNLAPSYVFFDLDNDYFWCTNIDYPKECGFPIDLTMSRDQILLLLNVASEYFSSFLDDCDNFYSKYVDVIDDGYLRYLDGIRFEHCSSLPSREVTDDLILESCNYIVQKNAIELSKEILL